jgi:hypothetical protein
MTRPPCSLSFDLRIVELQRLGVLRDDPHDVVELHPASFDLDRHLHIHTGERPVGISPWTIAADVSSFGATINRFFLTGC